MRRPTKTELATVRKLMRAAERTYVSSDNEAALAALVEATARIMARLPINRRLRYLRDLIDGMFYGIEALLAQIAAARRKQKKKRGAGRRPARVARSSRH